MLSHDPITRSGALPALPNLDVAAVRDDPVLRLVVERARVGSRPGRRTDGANIALAIEGGGMAGAVSGGMCVALESLGLIPSFDVIYGSSAGAINASYTAAGQARTRASLYPLAARERLIDPRRTLRGQPPFRLAELMHSLLRTHPHDDAVLHARPPLRITATRVEDKGLDVLADFTSIDELRRAVWASCAVPILTGGIVEFRGRNYVDGGLVEALPYDIALREGATHVLVLRARRAGHRFQAYPDVTWWAIDRLLRNAPDTIAELLREAPMRYNMAADALESGRLVGRVQQLALSPDVRGPHQFEPRPQRIVAGLKLGIQTTYQALAPYLAPTYDTTIENAA